MTAQNIVELLRQRSSERPERVVYRFLGQNGKAESLTAGELDERARSFGGLIQERGLTGERALLAYPPGLEYICWFFACLYAGTTPVPCYPPGLTRASASALGRIGKNAGVRAVITPSTWARDTTIAEILKDVKHPVEWLTPADTDPARAESYRPTEILPDQLAFLQYTSGSTGDPKGVMVHHGALWANLEMIQRAFQATEADDTVFWLPPYHDMGLIGGILGGLFCGTTTHLLAPATFMRAPLYWLRVISDVRATITGAPNFAFDRCVRALETHPELAKGLDLGSLEITFNGAEMVRADTLRRFCEAFEPFGFRPESLMPCYGMAETTLIVSSRERKASFVELGVDRAVLDERGRAVQSAEPASPRTWNLVGCGKVASNTTVRIVNPESHAACAEGEVGEVWVHSPSVARGYWGRPELSEASFRAKIEGDESGSPFLRTGDRGFFVGEELYIAGRLKDLFIAHGRNYAPEDIESSVRAAHSAIKPHRCVAIALEDGAREELGILFECESKALSANVGASGYDLVLDLVHKRVLEDHGLDARVVAVVKSGSLPVTTSGKLQRRLCREQFLALGLPILARRAAARPETPSPEAPATPEAAPLPPGATAPTPASEAREPDECLARVTAIVRRKSGIDPSPNTRLCELGLDSLRANALCVELSDACGTELPPCVLAPENTIASVAEFVSKQRTERAPVPAPARALPPTNLGIAPTASTPLRTFDERLKAHQEQYTRLKSADLLGFNLVQERKLNSTDSWVDNQHVTFFSSYSYLGLNHHPAVARAKVDAVQRYGTGAHGVMMLGGYTAEHKALEAELASTLRMEDAVLYSSGYAANMAFIDSLMRGDGTIFCDMLVHTSIADGCRLSGADVQMFPHQDAAALDRLLSRNKRPGQRLVIVDGVYSLRGEITNLPEILAVTHAHGALLMVDEAHALGAIGEHGRGTAEHFGLEGKVDVLTGGLGKGIPAYGGYVAARKEIIDYLRFRSNPYVYSGGMDPANVAAARAALRLLHDEPSIMARLRRNIALVEGLLEAYRVPSLRWGSPCMPVVCKDDQEAFALSRELRRRGFFIAPIVYPAVPKDQQGLRLTVTAAHTEEQITACVQTLDEVLRDLRLGERKQRISVPEALESPFSTVPEALDVFARGGFLLVADDEDRENEGDFVIAAEHATPAAINFMITQGKGLVCLAISPEIAEQKQLKPMVVRNREYMGTAFTVSIDAAPKHGITTGISAEERAKTVEIVISEEYGPEDLVTPGHMFPLVAKPGGLHVRTGHTEAGVDLARLAGCKKAAAVIVEVIKDDGTMARRDDLALLARRLDIPFITTAQLVQFMREKEAAEAASRRAQPQSAVTASPLPLQPS